MLATIVTAITALAAVALGSRLDRRGRVDAQREARRVAKLDALKALASALADHRRAMWLREDIRLTAGADSAGYGEARAASHATRSALEAPLMAVRVLLPELTEAATDAARATYRMRDASDRDALEIARESALSAASALTTRAARVIAS